MDSFQQYRSFVKGLEKIRLEVSPYLRLQEAMAKSVQAMQGKALGRSMAMEAILKQIKPSAMELRLIEAMKPRPIDLAWFDANKRLAEQLGASISRKSLPFSDISKQLGDQHRLLQQSIQNSLSFASRMESLSPSIQKALMTQGAVSEQLVQALKASSLVNLRLDVASRLFIPQGVFANFARQTIEQMGVAPNEAVAKSLQCSLSLAEEQLLNTVGCLSAFVEGWSPTKMRR